ncbi:MAG: hypothetical protein LIO85_09615 [Rikenellaceae bacterium]|nr:hypothetical protein [Rikenellaceae bacterium]
MPGQLVLSPVSLDLLKSIPPYPGDSVQYLEGMDLEEEISRLSRAINQTEFNPLPLDKYDLYVILGLSLLHIATSVLIMKNTDAIVSTANGGINSFLGSAKENLSTGPDSGSLKLVNELKQHSGRYFVETTGSFSDHITDVPRVLKEIQNSGIDGVTLKTRLAKLSPFFNSASREVSAIFLLLLAFRPFISILGTKIPGFPTLIPSTIKTFKDGVDYILEQAQDIAGGGSIPINRFAEQSLDILSTEIASRLYLYLRYKNSGIAKEKITDKYNKLTAISYGISTGISLGKIIITGNPLDINILALVRCIMQIWKVHKDGQRNNLLMNRKLNMADLKNQMELLQTVIMFDEHIYYTRNINELNDRLIMEHNRNMATLFNERNILLNQIYTDLNTWKNGR